MAKNGFKILDSDMHIMEPPDLWEHYIDGKFERARRAASPAIMSATCAWSTPTAPIGRIKRHRKTIPPG